MADATKTTRARPTKRTAVKKEASNAVDLSAIEKQLATLSKRCDTLEAKCAKLEKSKNSTVAGDNPLTQQRWDELKLFLEKKFGRGYMKTTGLWKS